MRNPNGYGTVVKLSGNRRNPYAVRKTTGWNEKGYPIYTNIGYAPTREAGMIMLAEYNKQPWDVDVKKITFKELYNMLLEKRTGKLAIASVKVLKTAYKHCTSLYNMPYCQIKALHMQDCIDSCTLSYSSKNAIKNLFNHLDSLAMELDIISKRYSDLITSNPIPETSKTVFTESEIESIWQHQNDEWVDSLIFFLYTGFRISEFIGLKVADIDLEHGTMKGGVKTTAGKNRLVPIHSKIFHIVQHRIQLSQSGYLFEYDGKKLSDSNYRKIFDNIMKSLNMHHTPHECRHTFRSRLDSASANKVCIDRIMGHKSKDTGERVYTHKTINELKKNIELVTN